MKKKLISAVLALVIVLGLLPMAVFAAGSIEGEGTAKWLDTDDEYTVSQYLADAHLSGIIDSGTGKLVTGKTLRDLQSAAANFLYAKEADKTTTTDEAKAATAAAIAEVQAEYDAVTKLDLSDVEGLDDLGVLEPFTNLTELDISDATATNLGALVGCTKLAKLTAKNLTVDSVAPLLVLAQTEGLDVTDWDLTGLTLSDSSNAEKVVLNALVEELGDALTGVEAQPLTVNAKLTSLTVGGEAAELPTEGTPNEAGITVYDVGEVDVGESTDAVTVAPTCASGYKITKVLFSGASAPEEKTEAALTNIDVSDGGLMVHLVVGKDDDAYDKVIYIVHLTKEAFKVPERYTVKFAAGTGATGTKSDVTVDKAAEGNTEYTLPDTTGFTAPSGKEFDKWTVNVVEGVSISEGKLVIASTVATSAQITLTATWKPVKLNTESNVEYTPYRSTDEGYRTWLGGHLKLKGLQANNYYLVQLSAGSGRAYQVLQANGSGEIDMIAQPGAMLQVALIGASNSDVSTFRDDGFILETNLDKLPPLPTT